MSVTVRCQACQGTGRQDGSDLCFSCMRTGQAEVDEELVCSDCIRSGRPESWIIYRGTLGTTAIWRCEYGHRWTQEVVAPS
jgi:hypothetical protein